MFCWKCGKELRENASFCIYCGAPAVNEETLAKLTAPAQTVEAPTAETAPAEPAETSAAETTPAQAIEIPATEAAAAEPAETSAAEPTPTQATEIPATEAAPTEKDEAPAAEAASAEPPAQSSEDLVVRRKHIILSGGVLGIDGKYYQKKGRRFRKKKGHVEIPLASVTGTSVFRTGCVPKAIVWLVLFAVFVGGTLVGGNFGLRTLKALNTPYRQEETEELEKSLDWIQTDSASDLDKTEEKIQKTSDQVSELESLIEEYQQGRENEILQQIGSEVDFDSLFEEDFFQDAYDQYLHDLIAAFKNDELLHSWLYPYYTYALENGTNPYISEDMNADMWFYGEPGQDDRFADYLTEDWYVRDRSLYNRITESGRIYITASDLMSYVLWIPPYVPDNAVFVKAFGGNPDPADMSVPGWSRADYRSFWGDPDDNYGISLPVWIKYDISAEDFDIDWNQLVNEQAYYDAYVKFMNTIAPGLDTYDMVSYYGSDDAYGGMCFDMTGKEASATEIALLYLENHPDAMKDFDPDSMKTSYDSRLAEAQAQYEQATKQMQDLEEEKAEMTSLIDKEADYRSKLQDIYSERDSRKADLTKMLFLFCGIAGLSALAALIGLFVFIHYAKKPRRLLVLETAEGPATAFGTGRCPKQKLEELQKRLP